jgi:glyoxylase-like metal-dependent hydrolase (beta-lactamase superfamily II)
MRVAVVPVTPFQQNCSLVWDPATRRGAVVDPGGDLDHVLAVAEREGVAIEKILLTHAHIDHAGATAELARRLGVPIEGPHEGDRFWIEALAQQAQMFGLKSEGPFEPDRWLRDGDTVTVGGLSLDVRHCPGHTPGHVVFFHAPSRFAIVGDVLFQGSIGRTDFPGGNHGQLIRSIREQLFPLGDDVRFLPGHGPTSTFGAERQSNPYVSDAAVGKRGVSGGDAAASRR